MTINNKKTLEKCYVGSRLISSVSATFKAFATVSIASNERLALPLSMRLMYERAKPHLSAKASCDKFMVARKALTRLPKMILKDVFTHKNI